MLPVSSLIKVPVPYIWSKPQIPKLFILLKLNEESSNLIKGKRHFGSVEIANWDFENWQALGCLLYRY
jgi:hypothetical protein